MEEKNLMYEVGRKHGSDKLSIHQYHKIYDFYLKDIYEKDGGMIEIGLLVNRSLKMWLELFPNMHIYGVDINPTETSGDSHTILKCDQSSKNDLEQLLDKIKHPIHYINDDGSHIPEHQALTFNTLFPLLEPGGIYIIEDIEVSYWEGRGIYGYKADYGLNHPKSIMSMFKKVADGINISLQRHDYRNDPTRGSLYRPFENIDQDILHLEDIHSITFARNCIIVRKEK